MRRVAVVGAGWSGLAAAVQATSAGAKVTLFEMARAPGGRARTAIDGEPPFDNGQHVLIGAYRETLALMRDVGIDVDAVLLRMPLRLVDAGGRGLRLPPGPPVQAFVRAVCRHPKWSWQDRWALLRAAAHWRWDNFGAPPSLSVAELTERLPAVVRQELITPLCIAALNTPPEHASAQVFLRVLRDGLFMGTGGSDLLLPRRPLSELLPLPAVAWLNDHGASMRMGTRVESLQPGPAGGWRCNDESFDGVVLACTAHEAARLTASVAPVWSARAASFQYEPIVTVYLRGRGPAWPEPMVALSERAAAPAQFAIDLGAIDPMRQGTAAFVVSGASRWMEHGLPALSSAVLAQASAEFPSHDWTALRTLSERRATFLCTPALERPPLHIAPGLWAAGDYVQGPYPATLEGAVQSGRVAARLALDG